MVKKGDPCPFCKCRELRMVHLQKEIWMVECTEDDCGASGPFSDTPEKAVKKWNKAKR